MSFDVKKLVSDLKPNHPRIILTEENFSDMRKKTDDPVMVILVKRLIEKCEKYLTEPFYPFNIPDGIRLLSTSRKTLARVTTLAIGYNITGNEKYAENAYEQMVTAAGYPSWNPRHFLDTAEMCNAFGIGYDLLYSWLGDERRAFLREAILRQGITQVMKDYENTERDRTYRWYQSTPGNNWKLVCNGGTAVAILAILDDLSGEEKEMCIKALDCGFKSSYDLIRAVFRASDGDYFEGIGYWQYACNYLAYHSASLISACGSDYGLTDCDAIRKTPYFLLQLCGNTSVNFNFSDSGCGVTKPHAMLYFATLLNDPSIASVRVGAINEGEFAPNDLLYYRSGFYAPMDALPTSFGAIGVDNATFRTDWNKDGMFCAVHFGRSDIPHAHLDTGTFILESEGERFFIDLGSDNYNLRPYNYAYRYRAEGHNTLVFNPSDKPDQERVSTCLIKDFADDGNTAYAECDISAAYPTKKVIRRLELDRKQFKATVTDKIECAPEDNVYWFAHTKADIEISGDGKSASLTQNGKRLIAKILGDGVFNVADASPFPTSPIPLPAVDQDGTERAQSTNEGIRKLAINITGSENYLLKVSFEKA